MKVVLFLSFILLGLSSVSAEMKIISPEEGLKTTATSQTVGWTMSAANVTQYIAQLSTDGFLTIAFEQETMNTYTTFRNLETRSYDFRVQGTDGSSIIDAASPVRFTIVPIPEFTVNIDTSEYEEDKIVIFTINAPLGSKIGIHAKSQHDRFSYHPPTLTTHEFRTILEPGVYTLEANLTYLDYSATTTSTFSLDSSPVVANQGSTPQNNVSSTAKNTYTMTITTMTGAQALPSVDIQYHSLPKNASDAVNGTALTGPDGTTSLTLMQGSYLMTFQKEGYLDAVKLIELDHAGLRFEATLLAEPESASVPDIAIVLESPQKDAVLEGKNVVFGYLLAGTPEKCQILLSQGSGWNILHTERNVIEDNRFLKETLAPGTYQASVTCTSGNREYSSEEIRFTIRSESREIPGFEETESLISRIEKQLADMTQDQRKILDHLSLGDRLRSARETITKAEKEYAEAVRTAKPAAETDSLHAKAANTVDKVRSSLPTDITFTNIDTQVVYLPISGFEEIFNDYARAVSPDTAMPVKKHKAAQEDFMVKMEVKRLTITSQEGEERITAVTETVSSIGTSKPDAVVLVTSDSMRPEVINKASTIADRFIEIEGSSTIQYLFRDHVPLETATGIKTIVLTSINESANSPTSMAIFDLSLGGNNTGYYLLVIFLTVAGIAGTMFMYSPRRVMKKRADTVARQVHAILDHLENNDHSRAFSLLPNVLNKRTKLSSRYQNDLAPIMQHLRQELEAYQLGSMLRRLEENIIQLASAFDHKRYDDFIGLYDLMMTSYNSMDDPLKARYFDQVNKMYDIVRSLEDDNL